METEKLIKKCPVCGSENIKQVTLHKGIFLDRIAHSIVLRAGESYCDSCGVKFAFNSLSQEEFGKGTISEQIKG